MREFLEIIKTCTSCDNCRIICPENCITTDGESFAIDKWSCTRCSICLHVCPSDSIVIKVEQNQ